MPTPAPTPPAPTPDPQDVPNPLAAFVAHRTRQMRACNLAGMAMYWLLAWLAA